MKSGNYTFHELLAGRDIEQLLVPEIQRDYVWGPIQLQGLLEDLRIASHNRAADPGFTVAPGADDYTHQAFLEFRARQLHSHGVGFIYAYQDPAYPGKAMLIDGQQRLTTLYLLLLALALRAGTDTKSVQHFKSYYLWQSNPKVDYRVRESAHTFLQRYVGYLLAGGSPMPVKVKQQYWYFSGYDDDSTIQNAISNYSWLVDKINHPGYQVLDYDYVRDFVQFQYFDTNLSSQGEELYLSLNSTGHPTEDNENIRALLLEKEALNDRQEWGRQWEKWQDFFWLRRGESPNADKGFNEFLRWVWIIVLLEQHQNGAATQLAEGKLRLWTVADDGIRLTDVARGFKALVYVYETLDAASQFYGANWLSGGTSRTQLTQVELFRLLPVLRFCLSRPTAPALPAAMLHRLARYFYNISRPKSIVASIASNYVLPAIRLADSLAAISEDITDILDLPLARADNEKVLLSSEERWKLYLYRQPPTGVSREEVETQLWGLEDDDWSLGQISHLFPEIKGDVIINALPTAQCIADVCKAYALLFPNGKHSSVLRSANQRSLQSLLLYYGSYWQISTPTYYTNCAFDDWYETVRTIQFQKFFIDFTVLNFSLKDFYQGLKQQYFAGKSIEHIRSVSAIHEQLFVLATLFYEVDSADSAKGIWQHGHFIGYKSTDEEENEYPFFTHDVCYVNARRYPYKDSYTMCVVDHLAVASSVDKPLGLEELLDKLFISLEEPSDDS